MTDFCIQIHPHRATALDIGAVRSLGESLAADKALIQRFAVVSGTDGHDYVNLMFATPRPQELWRLLDEHFYQDDAFGGLMRTCSMTMCEGAQGWNDYLLLHHFDPAVPLNRFEDR